MTDGEDSARATANATIRDETDQPDTDGFTALRPTSRLSRESIVATAIGFIDRHGLPALTMRALGATCGVEAMALYRYVHGRGDLLTGVVNHIVDRLHDDQLAARRQEDGWQDYLVRLAHGVRQIALDHPEVFPLIATHAPRRRGCALRCAACAGWRPS